MLLLIMHVDVVKKGSHFLAVGLKIYTSIAAAILSCSKDLYKCYKVINVILSPEPV